MWLPGIGDRSPFLLHFLSVVRLDVRYRRRSDVVYRNGWFLLTGVLAGALWLASSLANGAAAWFLVGLLVVPVEIYLNLRLRVVLGDSRLYIHEHLSTELIPYEAISAVRFTGRRAGHQFLEIHLTDGSIVGVHHSRASFFPFHEPGWQRPLADEIMKRVNETDAEDVESAALLAVAAGREPTRHPGRDSRSDRERQDRRRLAFAVSTGVAVWVVVAILSMDRPLAFLGSSAWFVATVLTVTLAVRYTWQRVLSRIPARYAESPSTPIRILTAIAKAAAVYAVGLLALAAALDVPTFLMQHL